MFDSLTEILTIALPTALGFLNPVGLPITIVTGLAGLVAHFTASAVVATTRTPDPKTTWGKIYRLIEVLALAIAKAKDKA